jgi:flagellum-specific peptidoglycan hydrolase FlgJ
MRVWILFLTILWVLPSYAGDTIKVAEDNQVPELTIANVKKVLKEEKILFPEIVLRQAITETGWFKCTNCSLSRNNIFGFYYKKKYLVFDNWVECVRYYKRWQGRHYVNGDYYAFLKKIGYATNPRYIEDLKAIKLDKK